MILLISLARNAVFVDVTGCPCAHGIGAAITRRYAESGFETVSFAIGSTVALRIDCPEPAEGDERARKVWDLKRACASGLALTWAAENKAALAVERREEPMSDGAGVFGPDGWKAVE